MGGQTYQSTKSLKRLKAIKSAIPLLLYFCKIFLKSHHFKYRITRLAQKNTIKSS